MTLELAQLADLDAFQAKDPTYLLTSAQEAVRTYCRWHVSPSRTDTLTSTMPFRWRLFLPTLHLTSVTSVTENGTILDASLYEIADVGYLSRIQPPTCLPWGAKVSTVVVFTHGYDEPPTDLQDVVVTLANRLADMPGLLRRVGQVEYAVDADAFTDAEKTTLRAYRIPAMP